MDFWIGSSQRLGRQPALIGDGSLTRLAAVAAEPEETSSAASICNIECLLPEAQVCLCKLPQPVPDSRSGRGFLSLPSVLPPDATWRCRDAASDSHVGRVDDMLLNADT